MPIVEGLDDWARATDGLGADGVVDAVGISAAAAAGPQATPMSMSTTIVPMLRAKQRKQC